MFADLPRPTIFAHRGASAYAPENTLAAFNLALRQGADAIELDAKLSGDGQVVVIHDQTIDRTTGMKGKVSALSLVQLSQLDAGSHFDVAFRGEPVPALEQVFEEIGRQTFINVELTNYASVTDSLPDKVAALVKRHKLEEHILFSSFNPIALFRIHRLLPQVPIGLLADTGPNGALARSPIGYLLAYQALHPERMDVTQALVERIHRRDCRVHVYTVNQSDEMRRLFDLEVDGIFTDDPVLARKVRMNPQVNPQ